MNYLICHMVHCRNVNYLIMAQAGNKAYVCAIEAIAVIE